MAVFVPRPLGWDKCPGSSWEAGTRGLAYCCVPVRRAQLCRPGAAGASAEGMQGPAPGDTFHTRALEEREAGVWIL